MSAKKKKKLGAVRESGNPGEPCANRGSQAGVREPCKERKKNGPTGSLDWDARGAIAESSSLRGLMLHGFAWAPDELVGAHFVPDRCSRTWSPT